MWNDVTRLSPSFDSPKDVLRAIYSSRNDAARLQIVASRLKEDTTALTGFTERDISHLILMALADRTNARGVSDEEYALFPAAKDFDHFSGKRYMQSKPLSLRSAKELHSQIDEIGEALRVLYGSFHRLRSEYLSAYPNLEFLLSSTWWPRVMPWYDEIELSYGRENPFKVLSNFFGHFLYGDVAGSPLDGGPIVEEASDALRSIVHEVLVRRRADLEPDFVTLAEVAMGQQPPTTIVGLLEQIDPNAGIVPEVLSGLRLNLAFETMVRFVADLPTDPPDSFEGEDRIARETFDRELPQKIAAFSKLIDVCKWSFSKETSTFKYDLRKTASISRAIEEDNRSLLINVSRLTSATVSHFGSLTIDPSILGEMGRANSGENTELPEAHQLVGGIASLVSTTLLFQAEALRSQYIQFIMHHYPDAPSMELGAVSCNLYPFWRLPFKPEAAPEYEEIKFLDLASFIFSECSARMPDPFNGPLEAGTTDKVMDCVEVLLCMGLNDVGSALLAAWIELQATTNHDTISSPLRVAGLIAKVPENSRCPIDIALSRALSDKQSQPNPILRSIFQNQAQGSNHFLPPTEYLKLKFGEGTWELMFAETRNELIAAETDWYKLRQQPSSNAAATSFRAPFANWGPAAERELKHALTPLFEYLRRQNEVDLSDRRFEHLQKFALGEGSLLELVNLISNPKGQFKNRLKRAVHVLDASLLVTSIFGVAEKRARWKMIAAIRNRGLHDDKSRLPLWDDVYFVHLCLIEQGLLKELVAIGHGELLRFDG